MPWKGVQPLCFFGNVFGTLISFICIQLLGISNISFHAGILSPYSS